MKEKDFPGMILDLVLEVRELAVDFHRGALTWEEFKPPFLNLLLELTSTLINIHLFKIKKGG